MQVMAVTCPSCGAQVDLQPGQRMAQCQFCGAQVMVDDGVQRVEQRITYDNAEEAGYSFERGRQRAQREAGQMPMGTPQVRRPVQPAYQPQPQQKTGKGKLALWVLGWLIFFPIPLGILIARAVQKRQREEGRPVSSTGSIILWVLGWIFVFPVPLTILMLRKKDMPKAARIAVIAAGWLAYLLIIGIGMATSPKGTTKGAQEGSAVTASTRSEGDKEKSKTEQDEAPESSGSAAQQTAGNEEVQPAAEPVPADQAAPAEGTEAPVDGQLATEAPVSDGAPQETTPVQTPVQ